MKREDNIACLPRVSVASMLPFGSMLRPLLNDSCLSDADLNNVLKSRGVFVGNSDKKNTVPLIVTMVLSPKEFEMLQEKQETKESHPKHRNSTLKSNSNKTLVSVISDFEINLEEIEKLNEDVHLNSPMVFQYASSNQLILDYNIIREDLTRDWVRPQSTHSAKIIITKDETSREIQICNEYTSKETDDINKKIIKEFVAFMKSKGESEDKLVTISAYDFNNRERFNFMLQLAEDSEDGSLEFIEIRDVEIGPDPDNPPQNPNSIIQQNVKKVIINGTALERNSLLTSDQDKDNLLLRSIEVAYKFNCNGVKGTCVLQYGFMHFFRNQNTSQDFQVALRYLNARSGNKTVLNNFVLSSFDSIKRKKYELFKAERNLVN
ncbi:hypothetical protein P4U99_27225 [Brevibacillus agri]|uniref:hypothetical protein n=1 Tax=Brevibacillus TaxID=55080 RepID=UPI0003F7DB4C|nr:MULTISPECIES: hypothetical protein [Brevibacillus]MED1646806.1 hypothetical protein [Brevibacillus agri]MED1657866.1 hypothetical protein [Brevibacillus agri]MED1690146.1 hypothetical protein [Brevibacillus agri]MED1695323.1 hypothetical protein [Brevibacillus agri]MED1700791.1 hypothetical protein [Brevibacillus agri]